MRGGIQGDGDAGRQGARVARGAHARVGHAPCPTGGRTTTIGTGQWAGPHSSGPGKWPVAFLSVSLLFMFFYIFCLF